MKADMSRWVPGLQVLRGYDASWLRHDITAGLVLEQHARDC